jgi:hypothetical protein
MGMFAKAMRLLECQHRLERAESIVRDIGIRLRESPEQEELRHAYRSANREVLMARRSLMDVIVESSEYAGPALYEAPVVQGGEQLRSPLRALQSERFNRKKEPRRA